uniref:Uncharacterized protein n=1 Tax=Moniliophthora roreri TaxID=221103 RepID=A0A0W0G575_MONRR
MPAPAVYVVAVVGTVAAGFAFKHFVYDPHIAPKVQQWKDEVRARREARRRRRAGLVPVPIAVELNSTSQRRNDDKRSDDSDSDDQEDDKIDKQSYELENMVSKEVLEWRNSVDQAGTLRQRRPVNPDSPLASGSSSSTSLGPGLPAKTISPAPAHILFDSSSESSTSPVTSTAPTRGTSPMPMAPQQPTPQLSSLHLSTPTSHSTLQSPPAPSSMSVPTAQLVEVDVSPPTPAANSSFSFPSSSPQSPNQVPSLSLLHPVDLDHEHDVELLSAPSSRPDTPFSNFSQPSSAGEYSAISADASPRSPPHVPALGIQQVLSPRIAQSQSLQSQTPSFYQTPIDGSTAFSRSHSDLEFLSFDSGSQRSMSFDGFEDVRSREVESEFGGSEVSTESSWASVSSDDEDPRDPAVPR